MLKIIQNPKTDKYKEFKEKVFSHGFPWTYEHDTNSGFDDYHPGFGDMPFYSHPIISRPVPPLRPISLPVSQEWELAVEVFNEIMLFNNIEYKTIYRMNINSTSYHGEFLSPPHVDHHWPHQSIIVYLNSFSGGKTHVFHKKYPFPEEKLTPNALKFSHKGEEDDIITFDGLHYHCMEGPSSIGERRVILVATYLI